MIMATDPIHNVFHACIIRGTGEKMKMYERVDHTRACAVGSNIGEKRGTGRNLSFRP